MWRAICFNDDVGACVRGGEIALGDASVCADLSKQLSTNPTIER